MRRAAGLVPYALLLVLALGLVGCGVSATDRPVDEGDAAAGGPGAIGSGILFPPVPADASQPDELVGNFLRSAAGGGAQANDQMKDYLAGPARANWTDPANVDNPPLSVVRVVSGPSMSVRDADRGTPVTVQYQPVGVLTDRGRVDELTNQPTQTLTFWVIVDDELNFRINEIEGWPAGQLLLADQGLRDYYQMQPIYYWDRDYTALVPDLRYVPRTITLEQRASRQLTWLTAEPSPWLSGVVQSLPAGIASDVVSTEGGALRVNLSDAASPAAGDADAAQRLMFQLRWSLADGETVRSIDLYIDDQQIPVEFTEAEFRNSLNTSSYRTQPERYDISEEVVRPVPDEDSPALLSGPENSGVVSAAIRREPDAAVAFVRNDGFGRRTLHLVTAERSGPADLPPTSSMGRPSFVPGTDILLVPTGGPNGRLVAVSVGSGATSDVTGSLPSGVSVAVVSPDGRRVALIADGGLYVAPLNVSAGTVTVGSGAGQLLAGQLTAATVTWTAESWLLVAGTRDDDEQPTLWRVTADGVVARDLSSILLGLRVDDLVCWPTYRNTQDGETEVLAATDQGVYTFRAQFSPADDPLTAPFFG